MRAVWVDPQNAANVDKCVANGISCAYFDARDSYANADVFDTLAQVGFTVGIYAAWNWENWTPQEFAEWVHGRLLAIGSQWNPWVCLDIETHDVVWILSALERWRALRPKRRTDWTLEPMQGGLFNSLAVAKINALDVGIVPQHYGGSMQPFAADRVALDLVLRGFTPLKIQGFYDAALVGNLADWSGFAFTQGRLP